MKKGQLFLCPTPIGNLEDITLRVLRVMQEVPVIAAEDTRRTRKLLSHYSIKTPLVSYREENRDRQGEALMARMEAGDDVALVSDAGMPGISDPGFSLICSCLKRGIQVEVLPGPSAILTGLVASGYQPVPFVFLGFLPSRGAERKRMLAAIKEETRTLVLYEAPHRVVRTLEDLALQGCLEAALCREMTKKYAEIRRGSLVEHLEYFAAIKPRGEFVIILSGAREAPKRETARSLEEEVAGHMGEGLSKKEAIRRVAQLRGLKKREVYRQCHGIKSDNDKNSTD